MQNKWLMKAKRGKLSRKNKKERLHIKNTGIEVKTVSNGIISRLDMNEERISELSAMSIETCQTEMHRGKTSGNEIKQNIQELWEDYKR